MPAKEIKELRKSGNLTEAYEMAQAELSASPGDIWAKRNISWVIFDFLKAAIESGNHEQFKERLEELVALNMPADEMMLFENICWTVGKYLFSLVKNIDFTHQSPNEKNAISQRAVTLYSILQQMPLPLKTEAYSFLFKGLHKIFKDHHSYTQIADWWNFDNFRDEDYKKDKLPNDREIMSIAEQAYICYAKHLLPRQTPDGLLFEREKAEQFIERLNKVIEMHPEYTYTEFYKAKLLLALGETENLLSAVLPFAKKKKNDFWVWDILADAFDQDKSKKIACYCKALLCKTPPEFLVNVHQKMASLLISEQRLNEAKGEIEQLVKARQEHSWKIPNEVSNWMQQVWYTTAPPNLNNRNFYRQNAPVAEEILYSDVLEEPVIIEFVNKDKKLAHFIASETKFGYFKYERFIDKLVPGDVVNVRFHDKGDEGYFKITTLRKVNNEAFKNNFYRNVDGVLSVPEGRTYGFVDKVYVPANILSQFSLKNGQPINGSAIKTYNKEKKQWGWKLMQLN